MTAAPVFALALICLYAWRYRPLGGLRKLLGPWRLADLLILGGALLAGYIAFAVIAPICFTEDSWLH